MGVLMYNSEKKFAEDAHREVRITLDEMILRFCYSVRRNFLVNL